mgnify:FL=1
MNVNGKRNWRAWPVLKADFPLTAHKKGRGTFLFLFLHQKTDVLRGGFGSVESLGKARNLAGGLLPMDDALGGGLIQGRGGGAQELRSGSLVISLDGGANRFHHILDAGLDGTIASSALHALLMTLDSRLVVGHDFPPGYVLLRPRRGVVAV